MLFLASFCHQQRYASVSSLLVTHLLLSQSVAGTLSQQERPFWYCRSSTALPQISASFCFITWMFVWFLFFFVCFGRPMAYEFPGQGSDANHTCDPCHSCCSPGSLSSCARPVIKLASQHSRDAADPTAPQGQPLDLFLSPLPAYCVRQHTTFQMIQDFYFLIERALYVPS